VNIVNEVATFARNISNSITVQIQKSLVSDEVLSELERPIIQDFKMSVISWKVLLDDGEQAVGMLTKKLEILTAIYETCSEFTQGPCQRNQLIIARAGVFQSMYYLFRFFGGIEMRVEDEAPYSNYYSNSFGGVFEPFAAAVTESGGHSDDELRWTSLEDEFSSEGVVDGIRSNPTWIGNDPLALLYMMRKSDASNDAMQEEFDGLLREKRSFMDSLRLRHDNRDHPNTFKPYNMENDSNSHPPNIYHKILMISKASITLEKATLKLCLSMLEGSMIEEDAEIPSMLLNAIGRRSLLANMCNYWRRLIRYSEANSSEGYYEDPRYERKLAYEYYTLSMRFADLPVGVKLKGLIESWIEADHVHVDKV
jgi:hypothetical protein